MMLHFTSDQWVQWLGVYFWPMLRIMALISTAPILSEKSIPKRVKVGLGIIISIIVAPSLPPVDIPIFSANAVWVALQQVMIGVAVGFTMQLAFAASSQYARAGAHYRSARHAAVPVVQRPSLAYLHAGGYVPYAADWRKSGEQQRFPGAHPSGRANLPERADAGTADHHPAADRQPGVRFTQPNGAAAFSVCHWFSADADGWDFINVITDATYRSLL
ncbi:hypothetical protein L1887_46226 [Cichorium endivia]|nr:hypothetical protein L1887_46226 [Cichorium endivia]